MGERDSDTIDKCQHSIDQVTRTRTQLTDIFSTSVSNVPPDVSDEDALSGAWRKRMTPTKTAEELDEKARLDLKRGISEKIWRTEKLELEVAYSQNN